MKASILAAIAIMMPGASPAFAAADAAPAAAQPIVLKTSGTYECVKSGPAGCTFLLYTTTCSGGQPSQTPGAVCTHAFLAEFTLQAGESKTFKDIPGEIKQCQPINGKLEFPACAH